MGNTPARKAHQFGSRRDGYAAEDEVRENKKEVSEMLLLPSANSYPRWGCDKTADNCITALVPALDIGGGGLKRSLWGAGPSSCAVARQAGSCRVAWGWATSWLVQLMGHGARTGHRSHRPASTRPITLNPPAGDWARDGCFRAPVPTC